MNRLIEGCDLPDDSIYNAWKTLHNDWEQIKEQIERRDFSNESSLAADIEPIVNSVLQYPSVERNQKKSRKQIDLPKHMTSEDALKILKAKEAEKRRLDIAKEAKRLEKLSKTKKAAPPKKCQKPMISSNELKRKSARARKSKTFDDFFLSCEDSTSDSDSTIIEEEEEIIIEEEEGDESEEENECGECKESYVTGQLWVQCDNCQKWYHAACTPMRKRTKRQLDSLESWRCKYC